MRAVLRTAIGVPLIILAALIIIATAMLVGIGILLAKIGG